VRRAALLLCLAVACSNPDPDKYQSVADRIMVIIPRGATYYQALDSLESRGVIESRDWFSLYARIRGLPSNLKSGVYTFDKDESWSSVVNTLKSGRGLEVRFTVTEGMMGFEVAERARSWLGVSKDSFTAAMRDTSLERELGIKPTPAGVDGYMYPTTYVVPMRMRARDLMKVMTHEFIARWQPEWDGRLGELNMTRHEIMTLASIIEAEVRYRPDRPYVSAVYHNRLRRGMALQADPTIVYAHGRRLRRVWERQLQIHSPYNTYLHTGLPPGPITQPSDSSIIAALYPAHIGYLYFVAQPDGKHIFSSTYADHLAAIRESKRQRRADRVN
jgi:peptidoglycan lytic transglycosylase G